MKFVYIDHNDSFANTIKAYFEMVGQELDEEVEVKMYKSDCSLDKIEFEEPEMIILGPGPNSPENAGNYLEVIDNFKEQFPIFGVCLGFQSLLHYFGNEVKVSDSAVHGGLSKVIHYGNSIFKGLENHLEFARYHSLGFNLVNDSFEELAYCLDVDGQKIVMAAQHQKLPLLGVQFHPESVLSKKNDNGIRLLENVVRKLVLEKRSEWALQ